MEPPIKILFIAGSGRSGSTILSTLLGHLPGFVSIGELTHLWVGILEGRPCGCAESFQDCPFWSRVLEPDLTNPEKVARILVAKKGLREQPILRRLDLIGGNRSGFDESADLYASILDDIYRRVQRASGCNVIVDSSHQPAHGYAVGRLPGVQLFVLHLVRDPRAVAFSKSRWKSRFPEAWEHEYMDRFDTETSARRWMAVNAKTEYFWGARSKRGKYMRLRYEDFADEPRATVRRIVGFLEENREPEVFVDSTTARLDRPTHHVEGNPVRFQSGLVEISLDDEWSTAMPLRERWATAAMTWPLLLRYGYLRSSRGRAAPRPGRLEVG